MIITSDIVNETRQDQERIKAATGSDYSVKEIIKALDSPVSNKGIADRFILEMSNQVRFDRKRNIWLVKSEGEFKTARTDFIRELVESIFRNLPKEMRVVNDAVKSGILSDDQSAHARKLINFASARSQHQVFEVLALIKGRLQ